jgi:hypothetical protein
LVDFNLCGNEMAAVLLRDPDAFFRDSLFGAPPPYCPATGHFLLSL